MAEGQQWQESRQQTSSSLKVYWLAKFVSKVRHCWIMFIFVYADSKLEVNLLSSLQSMSPMAQQIHVDVP